VTVLNEIARTIHAIRRAGDCDVERLCFEVSQIEWDELLRYLDDGTMNPHKYRHGNSMKVMGITVRKRPTLTPAGCREEKT